ncbi:MAG TPA: oxidoreductase [Candidatus Paceibacterota bacterium]|nr:oxidoreductase [Candidatus Paceibacterota bacterium]
MLNFLDNLLNRITMYRLALYVLMAFIAAGMVFAALGLLPFGPLDLLISATVLFALCFAANAVFAKSFKAPVNAESSYITAFILALIISPVSPARLFSVTGLSFFFWAAVLAMASKFVFAIGKKHVFNPAAAAVVLTGLLIGQYASWWVGTLAMLPVVFIGGLLIARKISSFDLVLTFFVAALAADVGFGLMSGIAPLDSLRRAVVETPLLFFGFVMLTEPMTTPPRRMLRMSYGAFVGLIFSPSVHIGPIVSVPELALITGNIFSYLVSPKEKYILKLREKVRLAPDVYEFIFASDKKIKFRPGQYLEWTLGHRHADARGNRRYFTIASAPTEDEVRLGVKCYPDSSSFKKSLVGMQTGGKIAASQLSGEFTLPADTRKKLAFLAGGIGITPFRSMIKDLLDRNERREIVLFYSNKAASEIVYRDVFDAARGALGIKTVYAITEEKNISHGWKGERGRVDAKMIEREMPDWRERTFYLSGPRSFVTGFEQTLHCMGISHRNIKTDSFPGF